MLNPFLTTELLLTVLTIISISLSTNREKTYGATLREINRIRGCFYYSFLHISLITCVLLTCHGFFHAFDLRIATHWIETVSLFYSICFLVQEIPVLAQSDWAIAHILRKRYRNKGANEKLMSQDNETTFYKMVQNITLKEGIKTSYETIKEKRWSFHSRSSKSTKNRNSNIDDLTYLIGIQNDYFQNLVDVNNGPNVLNENDIFKELKIMDAVHMGYLNIRLLVSQDPEFNIRDSDNYKNVLFPLIRGIYLLHEVCNSSLEMEKMEEKEMDGFFLDFLYKCPELPLEQKNAWPLVVIMAAQTLQSGEIWFAKFFKDNQCFLAETIDFDGELLGIFIYMIVVHSLNTNVLDKEGKRKLKGFLDESSDVNLETSLNASVRDALEDSNPDSIMRSLQTFIHMFDSLPKGEFEFHNWPSKLIYNPDKIFTKRDIVDYWLKIILLNWGYSIRGSDISAFLDALNKDSTNELSNELISALSNKWLVNGKLSNKAEPTFLLQCGYEKDFVLEQWKNNKEAIDSLARFYSNYREEQYNKESACLPFADTQKIKDKTIQSFAKAMEKIPFYQNQR